jgi:hypothetical protein
MFPLFPFAAGLLAGAATTKLIRDKKVKIQLNKAQDCLREASVNGLSTIEHSVAYLRDRIQATPSATDSSDNTDNANDANNADNGTTPLKTPKVDVDKPVRKLPAKSRAAKVDKASTAPARGNK